MEIKCIITDDEPIARKGLRSYIEKIGFLTLIGECEDAMQVDAMLKSNRPDLIFLDIEMPHITGLDFLSTLVNPPKIIVVSAYEQYALQGYELNVLDYLLKPVSFDRFLKSVNKAYESMANTKGHEEDHIFVKCDNKIKKIYLRDIVYITSMENYVVIHRETTKDIVYTTLKQIQENLSPYWFIQTHRSYLVNVASINAIEGNELDLGLHKVPIARNLREKVLDLVVNKRLIMKRN